MARENLGLFDTPAHRQEIRLGLVAVGVQFALLILIFPLRDIRFSEVGAFVPMIDGIMCVGELIIATKLCAQAAIFRSRPLSILAAGYAFGALLLIPHALTFPGAFTADGLLGAGVNTTVWIAMLVGVAYPIAVILYVVLKSADSRAEPEQERRNPRIFEFMPEQLRWPYWRRYLQPAGMTCCRRSTSMIVTVLCKTWPFLVV
jgi:hypothetical protein